MRVGKVVVNGCIKIGNTGGSLKVFVNHTL